jgi:hypothetical protein
LGLRKFKALDFCCTVCTSVLIIKNNKQTIKKDYFSELEKVQHRVPQGSILGPLLFLCYVTDIPSATNSKSVMYADNTWEVP